MSTSIIETDLDNGLHGDARVALVIAPARDCLPGSRSDELTPAISTNGGLSAVDTTGSAGQGQISLADALAALDCDYAELRAAIVEAHPEAESWDWASDEAVIKNDIAEYRERTLILAIEQAREEILHVAIDAGLRSASDALSESEGRGPVLVPDEDCKGDYDAAYAAVVGLLADRGILFTDADHESNAGEACAGRGRGGRDRRRRRGGLGRVWLELDSLVDDYRSIEAQFRRTRILAHHENLSAHTIIHASEAFAPLHPKPAKNLTVVK